MNFLEAFKHFNRKLITSLPMKDVEFIAELNKKDLFSGGLEAKVKAIPNAVEAADYFLDNKIEQDLINGNKHSFLQLLSVMEEYNDSLKMLAFEIRRVDISSATNSKMQSTNEAGK